MDLSNAPDRFSEAQTGWAYALRHAPPGLLKRLDRGALAVWRFGGGSAPPSDPGAVQEPVADEDPERGNTDSIALPAKHESTGFDYAEGAKWAGFLFGQPAAHLSRWAGMGEGPYGNDAAAAVMSGRATNTLDGFLAAERDRAPTID